MTDPVIATLAFVCSVFAALAFARVGLEFAIIAWRTIEITIADRRASNDYMSPLTALEASASIDRSTPSSMVELAIAA